jgi:DnaJ domain
MSKAEKQLTELKRAYQTLNVPASATTTSIKKAYRQLLKRWHPDLYSHGASMHAEATQMTRLINEAYSTIRQAPLRYYAEGPPQARAVRRENDRKNPAKARTLQPLNTDRIEFWVRFVCGAVLGFCVALVIAVDALTDLAESHVSATTALGLLLTCMFGCGFASARYGDRFWQTVIGRWLSWP